MNSYTHNLTLHCIFLEWHILHLGKWW